MIVGAFILGLIVGGSVGLFIAAAASAAKERPPQIVIAPADPMDRIQPILIAFASSIYIPSGGDITRLEPLSLTILGFDKLFGCSLLVPPVLAKDSGAAELDFSYAFFAILRQLFSPLDNLSVLGID